MRGGNTAGVEQTQVKETKRLITLNKQKTIKEPTVVHKTLHRKG